MIMVCMIVMWVRRMFLLNLVVMQAGSAQGVHMRMPVAAETQTRQHKLKHQDEGHDRRKQGWHSVQKTDVSRSFHSN